VIFFSYIVYNVFVEHIILTLKAGSVVYKHHKQSQSKSNISGLSQQTS